MKKGFTILELLVASLLLGMLVTILTMIFNQSSIAWRTGLAGVADLDDVRDTVAVVRDEADSIYQWENKNYLLLSPWDETSSTSGDTLRQRAISYNTSEKATCITMSNIEDKDDSKFSIDINNNSAGKDLETYTVVVVSKGPDRKLDTWDDVRSCPDEQDLDL